MVSTKDKLESERELLDELAEAYETGGDAPNGHAPIPRAVADRITELADAMDGEKVRHKYINADGNVQTFAPKSVHNYVSNLRRAAQRGLDLTTADADAINDFTAGLHDDSGLSIATVSVYQSAIVAFVRYHDDLGIAPDDVDVFTPDSTPRIDERDVFTDDDLAALRDACREPRDRALLELLLFSGQRITALRTLRVADVDVDAGVFYLNPSEGGLKGADKRGLKRPLLGARKYVREWLQFHPYGDDPEAWLFIGNPDHHATNPDEPWSESGSLERLKQIGERAGVTRPVDHHAFRHYFATTMLRNGMDSDTLRAMLGVAPDSSIIETTYGHVSNDEYVEKCEVAVGYREEEDEQSRSLTPESCPTCGELLESHWYRCPACGELFDADLKAFVAGAKNARDLVIDEATDPDTPLTPEERAGVRALIAALDDPVALLQSNTATD